MIDNIIKRTPLAFLVLWYFLGILSDRYLPINYVIWSVGVSVLIILSYILSEKPYSLVLILFMIFGIGGVNHQLRSAISSDHFSDYIDEMEDSLIVIVETAEAGAESTQKIIVNHVRIKRDRWIEYQGKILLKVKDSQRRYFYGDELRFFTSLRMPMGRRNPGEFDYKQYLINHHIFAIGYLEEKDITISKPRSMYSLRRTANILKYRIQDLIAISVKGEQGAILKALLVGVRSEIDEDTKQAFIDSGVIHVLAVSGLHVGYVALVFWVIFGFLRLPLKPKVILTILALSAYVLVVDIKPSVLRAVIMASMILIAKGWEKQVNVYNSLAVAAFIQTLIDPLQLFDMGFQLSFTAVFSIVYIYRRLEVMLPDKLHPKSVSVNFLKKIYQLFLVSLSALLGTLPITVYYFHRIPIISLLSNIIVIPLISIIGALGFTQIILGFCWQGFNVVYGEVETLLIGFMQRIIQSISQIPFAYIQMPQISLLTLILLYVLILALLNFNNRKIQKVTIIGLLVAANIYIWSAIAGSSQMTITFLDVGQGDAAVVELPSKKIILIDAADRNYRRDYGKLVVCPYLERRGIRKIDVMILSHPHNDHIGGAPYILRNMDVGQIWESGLKARSRVYREIHHLADSLTIPIITPESGEIASLSDEIKLLFLHPSERFLEQNQRNYNDASLVCKLCYNDVSVLFTGDAEKKSEKYLCLWNDELKSTILKVPHHGSNTSSASPYVNLIDPEIAIISVGIRNKFNHPSSSTLERYKSMRTKLYRTDINRAVQITTNGKIVKVNNWE
ncbi:MAG: DNA internalization-related competence protein ComEC/Rec2 [Candidatus Marinimicrobia bacterium]|nr:DNA internalization-related competence protein ComEC/Rec2 [Candidatus Neomarinimicrobiota bacterium]